MRAFFLAAIFLAVVFLLTACAAEVTDDEPILGSGGTTAQPQAGQGGQAAESAQAGTGGAQQPGVLCPLDNETESCECDDGSGPVPGRRTCSQDSGWSTCECAAIPSTIIRSPNFSDPAANRRPESFEWKRTLPTGGSCESGHYEGIFDGMYVPGVSFGFSTTGVNGGVAFDLGESSNGEFFEVSGGHMTGLALGMYPFEGEVQGTLDCPNLFFDGLLRNCSYIIYGLPVAFEGVLPAQYDAVNHAFVNGLWSVTEADLNGAFPPPQPVNPGDPLPPLPLLGGVGTWSATWVP